MKLHEAIEKLIKDFGRPMTTNEIASMLNENEWYSKKDGSLITSFQIHGWTKNYTQIFNRDGSLVSLKDENLKELDKHSKKENFSFQIKHQQDYEWLDEKNFKSASVIDNIVPSSPGIYCIRVKEYSALPAPYDKIIKEKHHNIIYIGIATQNLNERLLNNELRAKGHGTFFRSIGAILGYLPVEGSLNNNVNKSNYKFSSEIRNSIIDWINDNLFVNWIELEENLNQIESLLIQQYYPLLNIKHNPIVNKEFTDLRKKCIKIARG